MFYMQSRSREATASVAKRLQRRYDAAKPLVIYKQVYDKSYLLYSHTIFWKIWPPEKFLDSSQYSSFKWLE